MSALVIEPSDVAATAAAIASAPLVVFDVEFNSADRLVPQLCLLQVAWVDHWDAAKPAFVPQVPEVRLVDPIAGNAEPVVRALAAHPLVIAHAPRQDLGLLATKFGITIPGILDTQLMAAFSGIGDQVGLAALTSDLLGIQLAKEMQWTDWAKRPLSDAQLVYADADVRHLPALYAKLAAKLGDRMAWVREESAQIGAEAVAASQVTPESAWEHIGSLRGLDPHAMSTGIELATWRQRIAIELDRPLGQVMTEKVLVELAKTRPQAPGGVRSIKGLSEHARKRAEDIIAAMQEAKPSKAPPRTLHRAASVRAQRWAEMLISIVQVIADETRIAPRLLGTRSDAEEFARTFDERGESAVAKLPAVATWRRDLLGAAWLGWLTGKVALVGDSAAPHGVRLTVIDPGNR
ncbi:MAG: Ribonuclease [Myxococcales bacterium]|nr:Ribonuclease [Myxococcales bacterium]